MKAPLPFLLSLLLALPIISISLNAQENPPRKLLRITENLRPNLIEEGQPLFRLSERMKRYNTPGVSLAVVDNFTLVGTYESGQVNSQAAGQVSPETRFQAASISKLVNAVGILRLVESGKLDLDADVNTLLKSWKIPASSKFPDAVITTRMLLAHTAGLSTHGFGGYKSGQDLPSAIDVLNKAGDVNSQRVKIIQEPGKAFKYSGGGTTITQVLIEDLTGMPYTDYMQKEVLQPLEMTSSFYSVNQAGKESLLATAHYAQGNPRKNGYQHYPESAAAGVWTTPTDLSKLMIALMQSARGKAGLLSHKTVLGMMTSPTKGGNNGLGVFVNAKGDEIYFEHGGSNEGFKAQFVGNVRTGQGAIVMVNGELYDVIPEIVNAVATVYEWPAWFGANSVVPKDITIDKVKWATYAGRYLSKVDPEKILDISLKKGQLLISRPKAFSFQLLPLSPTKYLVKGANPEVSLEFMDDGTMRVTQGEVTVFEKEE